MSLKNKLKWIGIAFLFLCIAFYFCITNSFILKSILLPFLSYQFGFPVNAKRIEFIPLKSKFHVYGVSFGYPDRPFVTGDYGEWHINNYLKLFRSGDVDFSEMKIDGITFHAKKTTDGQWNLPWLYDEAQNKSSDDVIKESNDLPVILKFSEINIKNGNIIIDIERENPSESSKIEFYDMNLICPLFFNNSECNIKYNGKINISAGKNVKINKSDVYGSLSTIIDEWLVPHERLGASMRITNINGRINDKPMADHSLEFVADISSDKKKLNINKVSMKSFKNESLISNVKITGDIAQNYKYGKINLEAKPVSANLLNLFSNVLINYNFGDTKLFYKGFLSFDPHSARSKGELTIDDFQIIKYQNKNKKPDVTFDFFTNYNLEYSFDDDVYTLKYLNSFLTQSYLRKTDSTHLKNITKNINYRLNDPIIFELHNFKPDFIGNIARGTAKIEDMDMRFLNPFLIAIPNSEIESGKSNGFINFKIEPDTNSFKMDGNIIVDSFTGNIDELDFKEINLVNKFQTELKNFNEFFLHHFSVTTRKAGYKTFDSIVSGRIDIPKSYVDFNFLFPDISNDLIKYLPDKIIKNKTFINIYNSIIPFSFKATSNVKLDFLNNRGSIGKARVILTGKRNNNLDLALDNYIDFTWDNKDFYLNDTVKTNFKLDHLNLDFFNNFIPKYSDFKFCGGVLSTGFDCIFDKDLTRISFIGNTSAKNFSYKYGLEDYNNLDLGYKYKITLDLLNNTLFFEESNIDLDVKGNKAFDLSSVGNYNFENTKLKLNAKLNSASEPVFEIIPGFGSNYINKLTSTGSFNLCLDSNKTDIETYLKFGETTFFNKGDDSDEQTLLDHGFINLIISLDPKGRTLKRFLVNFKNNGKTVLNLDTYAFFPSNYKDGNGKIDIKSEKIDVDFLNNLFSAVSLKNEIKDKKIDEKEELIKSEYFDGSVIKGEINLKNIVWDDYLKGNILSYILIQDNKLYLNPALSLVDYKTISANLMFDLGYENALPYSIQSEIETIPVPVFFRILNMPKDEAQGNIQNFNLNVKGVNSPFYPSKFTSINGELEVKANDVVFPFGLTNPKYSFFRIMFLPLQVFSNIIQLVPQGLTATNVVDAFGSTAKIFTKISALHFKNVEGLIKAQNNIMIKKFDFYGYTSSLVRYMKFSGVIDSDETLKIETDTDVTGIHIPLEIEGTLDNPSPNIHKFVYKFIANNTLNILNPQNIIDILSGAGQGLGNTIEGAASLVEKPLQ